MAYHLHDGSMAESILIKSLINGGTEIGVILYLDKEYHRKWEGPYPPGLGKRDTGVIASAVYVIACSGPTYSLHHRCFGCLIGS